MRGQYVRQRGENHLPDSVWWGFYRKFGRNGVILWCRGVVVTLAERQIRLQRHSGITIRNRICSRCKHWWQRMAANQDLRPRCPEPAWSRGWEPSCSHLLGGTTRSSSNDPDGLPVRLQALRSSMGWNVATTIVAVQRRQQQVILWRLHWTFCEAQRWPDSTARLI